MNLLRKILAVVLEWPKTTVLLALALAGGGAYVWQHLAVARADTAEGLASVWVSNEFGGLVVATVAALVVVPALSVLVTESEIWYNSRHR